MSATPDPLREGLERLANQHEDYCCSKGCTGPGLCLTGASASVIPLADWKCDGSCNCHSAPYLALLAETAPAVEEGWDKVGGSMWFDRHQWGVIIDGLILQRAEAEARKATNEYSNSDERATMCVDLIERINAADTLATPPAPHGDDTGAAEVTDAMVERAARALVRDSARAMGHEPTEAEISGRMSSGVRAEARAALTAALTPEES